MALPRFIAPIFWLFSLATAAPLESLTCSLTRYGGLTMFNGETEKVELPCKYRLADLTCGGYQIKVTPGSSVDGNHENRFSPDTVWVSILKPSNGKHWIGRTSSKRLQGADVDTEVWEEKQGDLHLDTAGYDEVSRSAVLERNGVFRISLSRSGNDDDGMFVTCTSASGVFASEAYPKSLCGDKFSTDTLSSRRHELFGYHSSGSNHALAIVHDVLSNTEVVQSDRCQKISKKFQACSESKRLLAARICGNIFTARSLALCLMDDGDDMTQFDNCMTSICRGDAASCRGLKKAFSSKCEGKYDDIFAELDC